MTNLKSRLHDFITKHGLQPDAENGRSYIYDCPVCNGKKKLYIQKENGRSVCFRKESSRCPSMGSLATYSLHLLTGMDIKDIKSELFLLEETHSVGEIVLDWGEEVDLPVEDIPLPMATLPSGITMITDPKAVEGLKYLHKRGISTDMAKKYSITYSTSMRRVIFPVIMDGTLYGWQGRAIDEVEKHLRMYNLHGPWKSSTLMFYNNIINKEYAVLAEGAVSALKFELVGGFVASMGKSVSHKQLDLIKKAGVKQLYLALDRDSSNLLVSIERYMNSGDDPVKCYIVPIPSDRDDFGECSLEECLDSFLKSQPFDRNGIYVSIDSSPKSVKKWMESL